MDLPFVADKLFDVTARLPLSPAEYDYCHFKGLDLTSADLSGFVFSDCHFEDCNLSLAQVQQAAFRKVHFERCKLVGVLWLDVNHFGLELQFDHCRLDHAVFQGLSFQHIIMRHCDCTGADFTAIQAKGWRPEHCRFADAQFHQANLQQADFSTAVQYRIHPLHTQVKGLKVSWPALQGILGELGVRAE